MGNSQDPITLHKYLYANVDPVGMVDPSGNFAIGDFSISANIQTSMITIATPLLQRAVIARAVLATATAVTGTYIAAGHAAKTQIEECMKSSKAGRNECKPELNLFIVGDNNKEVRDHIAQAQTLGYPSMVSRQAPSHSRFWLEKYKGAGKPCSNLPNTDCDEYPFAANIEGGQFNNVSIKSVDRSQNRSVGAYLKQFHSSCNIPKNNNSEKYKVLPIKGVEMTGYVCKK